uniref:Odorant binding protein 4 n=1 Tax=Dendroctonus adjunctus TaxID=77157 RepID=A0A7U3W593_9CUCU|nr:Odorant binding protein 4 [Dendroctonus adjunctus]
MRSFAVCCVLVAVLQVRGAPLTNDQKAKLDAYQQDCISESKVNQLLVEQSRKGIFSDDPAFKNFLFCFSQKAGFQDANGLIQKDVFERKVKIVVDDEALVAKLLEQCVAQKATPQDTSYYLAKCLREVVPNMELFKVAPEVVYVSNEKSRQALLQHKECAAQDPLGQEAIEAARKQGILFEDAKFKAYIFCFSKKSGIQRDDGSIDKDRFYKKFGEVIDKPAVVDQLGQKCLLEQDTPENTALFVSKCIHENSPVYLEIFPRDLPIPEEVAKQIIAHGRACIKETGIDREILEKSREGIFSEDPIYKQFTFCMGKQAGFISEAGDVLKDVLKEKSLSLFNDPALVQKLIDQCIVKKDTPQETSYHAHVCLYKNSPGHLALTLAKTTTVATVKVTNMAFILIGGLGRLLLLLST